MDLKILDSILHGVLKPWKADVNNNKRFTELVRIANTANSANPATFAELQAKVFNLLADFPSLQKHLNQTGYGDVPLEPVLYEIDLPMYKDAITLFYLTLITSETKRIYNAFVRKASTLEELVDEQYHLDKILTSTKILVKQANEEMKEGGYVSQPSIQSDHVHYTLYYLKNSLIQLFFSIQQYFLDTVPQRISEDDFYILELEEPDAERLQMVRTLKLPARPSKQKRMALSFGFKGDESILKKVIRQLAIQVNLLNDEKQAEEQLFQLLISKDVEPGSIKLNLGCKTIEFAYIVNQLQTYFDNLNPTTIFKFNNFISSQGTPIKRQNLYSSNLEDAQAKEEIDQIINQLKTSRH